MMPIACPRCHVRSEVPDEFKGRSVTCPRCAFQFTVAPPPSKKMPRPLLPAAAPRKRSRLPVVAVLGILALIGIGTAAYFVFMVEEKPEATTEKAVAQGPQETHAADDPDRLVREKKAQDDLTAKQRADELAKKKETERLAKEAEDRRRKEAEARALEEKLERERQEKIAREEKEKKERLAKEEAARILFEKRNPKLTATLEEVDKGPDKFMSKRLYFDDVRLKFSAIDKAKDMDRFTLGVTSTRGTYFSRVPFNSLFFSASDRMIADIRKDEATFDQFPKVRLYCEMQTYEKKAGARPLPEARIFKIEAYNKVGNVVQTWEEPE